MRLFIAIAAKHRLNLFKSDTKQGFLNGDICDEKIYVIDGLSMFRTGMHWS